MPLSKDANCTEYSLGMAEANQAGMVGASRASYSREDPEVLAAEAAEVIFGPMTDKTLEGRYSEMSSSAAEVNWGPESTWRRSLGPARTVELNRAATKIWDSILTNSWE